MIRPTYPRELRAWLLFSFALGAVEGGVAGVLVKNLFTGHVDDGLLNTMVALVAGAPALAMITSFFWANLNQGRDKIRFLLFAQVACMLSLLLIAFAPIDTLGLFIMAGGAIAARCFWTAVTTVRATVWRANFPKPQMGKLAGSMVRIMTLVMGLTGIMLGVALGYYPLAFRWIYPLLAGLGLIGAFVYRGIRVRRQKILLRHERELVEKEPHLPGPGVLWSVLHNDRNFRRYMKLMFVFGTGNIMLIPVLIIILSEHYNMPQLHQMLITSSIPLLLMAASIPVWSRFLDRGHVIHYRARQSWSFPMTFAVYLAAVVLHQPLLFWLGAIMHGIGMGGGVLGWNLGHLDFAAPERAAQYMGTHVTLTGVRGLFAPLLGVWIYQGLEQAVPGNGIYVMVLPLGLATLGAFGFVRMSRDLRAQKSTVQ